MNPSAFHTAFLLLGSNLEPRGEWLQFAITQLEQRCGKISQLSAIYETAPWGKQDQPKFLNQAVGLHTPLQPEELLFQTLSIEKEAGRDREVRWGARTLDIDIILYEDVVMHTAQLTLPHPAMQERRFVLQPLYEIAPQVVHPVYHLTIKELLDRCKDSLQVKKIARQI
jgi:2-amino-4-hydroxy-6-hydroxymethyldihydropteridine diphosphokinase